MANTDERVRSRLRTLRTERGLTLEAVATRAGMSTSTLSRLESGARRFALDHLEPLAAALEVPVGELLHAPPPVTDPRVRPAPQHVGGMVAWPLSAVTHDGTPRVFRLELPERRGEPEQRTHAGHEWLYVLHGRVRLVLGDEDLVLTPGEAAEFDTSTPHWMGATGGPAEVLVLYGPQGERAHLRT